MARDLLCTSEYRVIHACVVLSLPAGIKSLRSHFVHAMLHIVGTGAYVLIGCSAVCCVQSSMPTDKLALELLWRAAGTLTRVAPELLCGDSQAQIMWKPCACRSMPTAA